MKVLDFLKQIFGLIPQRVLVPIEGAIKEFQESKAREKMIHISEIQEQRNGDMMIYFHFPYEEKNTFCIIFTEDEFTGEKSIRPLATYSYISDKIMLYSKYDTQFSIGLYSNQKMHYMTLGAFQKEVKFNIGDKFSLLLDDEDKWEFIISEKGYRKEKETDGVVLESKITISRAQLEKLSKVPVKKWRYYDEKKDQAYTNHTEHDDRKRLSGMSIMHLIGCQEFLDEVV